MSPEEVDAMKMAELKAKCKELGLPVTGVKAELAARIKGHYAGNGEAADVAEGAAEEEVAEDAAADEDAAIEEVAEDAQPAQAAAAGKHQPIVFSEDIAKKIEAQKVVVQPVAQPAALTVIGGGDKLKARAERFADPAVAKLKERAERFGLSHPELEKQKLLDRAQKFGTLHPVVEEEKRKKRAERFNVVSEEQKKKMRADKFKPLATSQPAALAAKGISTTTTLGDADANAKLEARKLRFQPQS